MEEKATSVIEEIEELKEALKCAKKESVEVAMKLDALELLVKNKGFLKYTAYLQLLFIAGVFVYSRGTIRTLVLIGIALLVPVVINTLFLALMSWITNRSK